MSVTLLVQTRHGRLFFKCGAETALLANEARLCEMLDNAFDSYVPQVIATEPNRNWLLTRDAGRTVGLDVPMDLKTRFVQTHAKFQQKTMSLVADAPGLGVHWRPPVNVVPNTQELLSDPVATARLTSAEMDRLTRSMRTIAELERCLAESPIPLTLVHGDAHLQNVAQGTNGDLTLLDWTEACVSWPFFDMFLIFNERDERRHEELRDAYLKEWDDWDSHDRLMRAWSACTVLHALHHAFSYASLANHTAPESRGAFVDSVSFLVRKAIRYLDSIE